MIAFLTGPFVGIRGGSSDLCIVEHRGRSWRIVEDRGRLWKIVEDHGRSSTMFHDTEVRASPLTPTKGPVRKSIIIHQNHILHVVVASLHRIITIHHLLCEHVLCFLSPVSTRSRRPSLINCWLLHRLYIKCHIGHALLHKLE